jgi:hypothetical protein
MVLFGSEKPPNLQVRRARATAQDVTRACIARAPPRPLDRRRIDRIDVATSGVTATLIAPLLDPTCSFIAKTCIVFALARDAPAF